MTWLRIRGTRTARFVESVDAARVRCIVDYFHRSSTVPEPLWGERLVGPYRGRAPYSFEEQSAYPHRRLGYGTIEPALIERCASLLPDMLDMLQPPARPMDLMRITNGIVASAVLTKHFSQAPRVAPTRKQMRASIDRYRSLVKELRSVISDTPLLAAALSGIHFDIASVGGAGSGDVGLPEMALLELIADMLLVDFTEEGDVGRYYDSGTTEAQPKLNTVEKAAYLCGRYRGPQFVTTPGSAFSHFASLLHEVATGSVGESMQGAITRFSGGATPSLAATSVREPIPSRDEMDDTAVEWHTYRARVACRLLSVTSRDRGGDPEADLIRSRQQLLSVRLMQRHMAEAQRVVEQRTKREQFARTAGKSSC